MSASWQLQPIFGSYLLVAALAACMLLLLFISPTFGQLSKPRKRWLVILRSAIALLLAVGMLRPALVKTDRQTQQALVLVLFDASRSMDYRDGEGGKTRWDDQQSLLRKVIPHLEGMGKDFEVELVAFSDGIDPQPKANNKLSITAKPTGAETDIGQAISEALQRHLGKRLAGVILISDGAQRAIVAETPPQQAAKQLDRRATPLYTVAIGRSRDQSQSRDVAIENLQDEYSVFVKNEFALRVGIKIQGYVNKPIPVSLIVEDEQGNREKVGTQELVASQGSQIVMADFGYRAEKAGQYRLYVEAERQEGELIENNSATAFLKVRDGGLRVLLLSSGLLQQEPKFIRRSLDESQEIELDYQLVNVLTRGKWPIDIESQVTLSDYDVFIVGDLDVSALKQENWSAIAQLVESGRGFMMYGGFHSFGPGGYADTPVGDMLPLELKRIEREPDPTKATRTDRQLSGEIKVVPTTTGSITHLAPDDSNVAAWAALKPMRGANKFDQLKDQAVVIAQSEDGEPLLLQSSYVGGRVLASAFDSTYRWWQYGQQEAHKRYWRQAVLWLARRDKQEANTVFIDLPQRRFMAGSKVAFTTGLTDEVGDSILDADLRATLTPPDGQSIELPLAATDGAFQGTIPTSTTENAGIYRIQVQAVDGQTTIASTYSDIVIVKEDFELSDPAANPGLLDMLARITSRVGGKAVAPEQLPRLLDDIKANPPKNEIELQSKWQLGDTWWDAWGAFGVLVVLLCVEWFLRKKWGLV